MILVVVERADCGSDGGVVCVVTSWKRLVMRSKWTIVATSCNRDRWIAPKYCSLAKEHCRCDAEKASAGDGGMTDRGGHFFLLASLGGNCIGRNRGRKTRAISTVFRSALCGLLGIQAAIGTSAQHAIILEEVR